MADADDLDGLAAEYALGVLDAAERGEVERRLGRDESFRRLVEAWERQLAPLAMALPPVEPRPEVWFRLARNVRYARNTAEPVSAPSLSPSSAAARPSGRPWRRQLLFWRGLGLGASLAAAGLAAFIVLRPPPAEVRLIAVLHDAQAEPAWLVSARPGQERLLARPVGSLAADARQVPELWLLPGGDRPPISLGLLDRDGTVTRPLGEEVRRLLGQGKALAVSLEPPGGSPTGSPTGPAVWEGVLLEEPS